MPQSAERTRRGRVLLLDDPGFFRDFVAHAFGTAGFELTLSDNEVSAIASLESGDFDLLAIEVRMAHLDAEAFIAELRRRRPAGTFGIIALSETGLGRSDLSRLRSAGIDDFVSKLAPEEHLVFRARSVMFPKGADARDHVRIAVSLPVRWRSAGLGAWSRSLTLSEGGLFVRTDAPPAMGTTVWIHFGLPDSARTLDLESVVVHVVESGAGPTDPAGFGVRFAGLSEDDRAALAAYVKRESVPSA